MARDDRMAAVPADSASGLHPQRVVRRADTLAGNWFLTSLVALGGPVICVITLAIDEISGNAGLSGFLVISPDSARTILGSIAGSLITIASLTASPTIATLQLLPNQYTPRAVRGFLRPRVSPVVSGTFIGTFVYSLLLLVAVREPGDENEPSVPSLGVATATVLATLGLVLLVLFINSLATTIQVSTMTAEIARETIRAVDAMQAEPVEPQGDEPGEGPSVEMASGQRRDRTHEVGAARTGCVRRTSVQSVLEPRAAPRCRSRCWPGRGTSSPRARRSSGPAGPASPGTNDPTTVVTCLGYLRWVLEVQATRDLPARSTVALAGGSRVVLRGATCRDYLFPVTEITVHARTDSRRRRAHRVARGRGKDLHGGRCERPGGPARRRGTRPRRPGARRRPGGVRSLCPRDGAATPQMTTTGGGRLVAGDPNAPSSGEAGSAG